MNPRLCRLVVGIDRQPVQVPVSRSAIPPRIRPIGRVINHRQIKLTITQFLQVHILQLISKVFNPLPRNRCRHMRNPGRIPHPRNPHTPRRPPRKKTPPLQKLQRRQKVVQAHSHHILHQMPTRAPSFSQPVPGVSAKVLPKNDNQGLKVLKVPPPPPSQHPQLERRIRRANSTNLRRSKLARPRQSSPTAKSSHQRHNYQPRHLRKLGNLRQQRSLWRVDRCVDISS